jgi:hypothetical protein
MTTYIYQVNTTAMVNHWIIRVKDGKNFKNSKYPIWGLKQHWESHVKNLQIGDILWFLTNKESAGKFIAMAEFRRYYRRQDEPLMYIHTCSNEEQKWIGDEDWDIQIEYINMYDIENVPIFRKTSTVIQCASCVMKYDTFQAKISLDLEELYKYIVLFVDPN